MSSDKQLWMLVGGNGAGKSTFYAHYLAPRGMQFVNADLIAKNLDNEHPEATSYKAASVAESLRHSLLLQGASFCFETVFSHPTKIDFLAKAKAAGYEVILVFIHLISDELNQARVSQRVSEGGHDVPPNKIISRIPRTLENVRKALPLVDQTHILDNSSADSPFEQVARLKDGELTVLMSSMPSWAEEVLMDYLAVRTEV